MQNKVDNLSLGSAASLATTRSHQVSKSAELPSYSTILKKHLHCPSSNSAVTEVIDTQKFHPLSLEDNTQLLKPFSCINGEPSFEFSVEEKNTLVQKIEYVLIGKFSHGRPSMASIKVFFASLHLQGDCNLCSFDSKHIFIECINISDFYKIWMNLNLEINGYSMRVFKWESNFSPDCESSIAPVWIRIESIPLYLFDKMSLSSISIAIGKPICIDSRNVKRTLLNCALLCVELDVSKPLVDKIWLEFKDEVKGVSAGGLRLKVCYDVVPHFCTNCCHLGHSTTRCQSKQNSSLAVDVDSHCVDVVQPLVLPKADLSVHPFTSKPVESRSGLKGEDVFHPLVPNVWMPISKKQHLETKKIAATVQGPDILRKLSLIEKGDVAYAEAGFSTSGRHPGIKSQTSKDVKVNDQTLEVAEVKLDQQTSILKTDNLVPHARCMSSQIMGSVGALVSEEAAQHKDKAVLPLDFKAVLRKSQLKVWQPSSKNLTSKNKVTDQALAVAVNNRFKLLNQLPSIPNYVNCKAGVQKHKADQKELPVIVASQIVGSDRDQVVEILAEAVQSNVIPAGLNSQKEALSANKVTSELKPVKDVNRIAQPADLLPQDKAEISPVKYANSGHIFQTSAVDTQAENTEKEDTRPVWQKIQKEYASGADPPPVQAVGDLANMTTAQIRSFTHQQCQDFKKEMNSDAGLLFSSSSTQFVTAPDKNDLLDRYLGNESAYAYSGWRDADDRSQYEEMDADEMQLYEEDIAKHLLHCEELDKKKKKKKHLYAWPPTFRVGPRR